jgi:hypothetical protein
LLFAFLLRRALFIELSSLCALIAEILLAGQDLQCLGPIPLKPACATHILWSARLGADVSIAGMAHDDDDMARSHHDPRNNFWYI